MARVLLIALAALMVVGILLAGFTPKPAQRVIFEGSRYKMVEDYSTKTICLFDKTEATPPDCQPLQPDNPNPWSQFPDIGPQDRIPIPETLPDNDDHGP